MRRSSSSRFLPATASVLALAAAALPGAALAQTETQQVEAQAQQDCDQLPTPGERQDCVDARASDQVLPGSTAGVSEDEMIVVTGSRIARAGFDTVEPAIVVGSTDVEARGFTTLGEALNDLPAFGDPGSSPIGDAQSQFGPGQSFVNFLGLGSQRTLTLVNGRRFVGSNTSSIFSAASNGSQVDLNIIPTLLLDRIETIAVGGAPIYGSDAIAGTVNVILKRNFEGISLDADAGISHYGDFESYRIRGLAGFNFADGRGNITFAGEWSERGGLVFNDRRSTAEGLQYCDPPVGATYINEICPDARLAILTPSGIPMPEDFVPLDPTPYPATQGEIAAILQGYGVPAGQAPAFASQFLSFFPQPSQADFFGFFFGLPAGFVDNNGNPLTFDSQGNLVPINFGTSIDQIEQDIRTFVTGGSGFQFSSVSNLFTPLKRHSAIALGSYDLTDNIRLFGEAWYSSSTGTNIIAQPSYQSSLFSGPDANLPVSIDNPFLSPQARAIIQAQATSNVFYLARANTDISSGEATGTTEVLRFVAGLDGNFELFGNNWTFEIFGNYGRSLTTGEIPTLVQQNFLNAVDAVTDASGNIICRPGYTNSGAETLSSTCAPLNLFGTGQASQAARDYITGIARPRSLNEQKNFVASLSGDLFELPAGNLGIALGYEHREESQDFNPGGLYFGADDPTSNIDENGDGDPTNDRESYTRSAVIFPVAGGYNTDEVFGEIRVPIISPSMDIPFLRTVELQAAGRWVDNSLAGGDFTWTVGGRIQPISDLTLRGNYTVAIRAPAVTDAFAPTSPIFTFVNDPCEASRIGGGPAPATRAANCAAAGIPLGFSSGTDNASIQGSFVGNPNLGNEKAESFSVGAVLRPSFIPGLTASVDYVRIRLREAISSLTASQVLAFCYDSPDFPSNQFCDDFTRDPNATLASGAPNPSYRQITFVETTTFNAARLDYGGILADVDYRTDTPFLGADSEIGVGISYQYIDELSQQADEAAEPVIIRRLTGYSPHQANIRLNYSMGGFGAQISADYIGEAVQTNNANPNIVEDNTIDEVVYAHAFIGYEINDAFGVRFIVNNLFNGDVPENGILAGGIASYIQGVLGRRYTVGATIKF